MKRILSHKNIITICIIFAILFFLYYIRGVCVYAFNYQPYMEYEVPYETILHITGPFDRIAARRILNRAETAFSTVTDEQAAEERFGALSRYCIGDEEVVRVEYTLKLVSADLGIKTGHMWVNYTQAGYYANGDFTCCSGSADDSILALWQLKKINGEWAVVSVQEPA